MPNYDVILDTISDGDTGNLVHNWFSDTVEGNPHTSGGDITRDRTKLAFATGENDSTLTVYSVPPFPTHVQGRRGARSPPARASATATAGPAAGATRPRRSRPTAAALAWSEDDGIKVVDRAELRRRLHDSTARRRTRRSSSPAARSPTGARRTCPPAAARPAAAWWPKSAKTKLANALRKGFALRVTRPARRPPEARRRPTAAARSPRAASASRPATRRSSSASPAAPAARSSTPAA